MRNRANFGQGTIVVLLALCAHAASGTMIDLTTAGASGVPQSLQNLLPSLLGVPQLGQSTMDHSLCGRSMPARTRRPIAN